MAGDTDRDKTMVVGIIQGSRLEKVDSLVEVFRILIAKKAFPKADATG
jgi:hypothetical protein